MKNLPIILRRIENSVLNVRVLPFLRVKILTVRKILTGKIIQDMQQFMFGLDTIMGKQIVVRIDCAKKSAPNLNGLIQQRPMREKEKTLECFV